MIEALRGYSANTKAFQTGSDMVEEVLSVRRLRHPPLGWAP